MAVKSILDIDVNDAAFQRFLQLFEEYQEKVRELPQEWQKVDEAIDGAGGSFKHSIAGTEAIVAAIAASTGIIAEEMHKANKGQEQFEKTTKRSHSAMAALGHAAKGVSKTIFGIGRTLLKFGAIGGALGGIAGGIGMDDLANVALSRQRTARGVGMTAGQHAAFSTYYGQFGNADAVASNIADARNDVTKRWIFNGLGIGQNALKNDNNFQLSMLAERDAQRVVKSAPRGEWMNIAKAMGLTQVFSDQTLRVMRHTSSARMDAARAGAIRNAGALGFSNKTAADWSQFSIALHKAGIEIETGLIVALHRLTPELTKIVNGVSDWINAFARGKKIQVYMADFETGIKKTAAFLSSPKFENDLKTFGDAIADLARETVNALRYFHLIPTAGPSIHNLAKSQIKLGQHRNFSENTVSPFLAEAIHGRQYVRNLTHKIGDKYNLPAHTLTRLAYVESGLGQSLVGPKTKYGTAIGVTQMLRATAAEWGVHNRYNEPAEISATGRMLVSLHKHYGSWRKAFAAYNDGIGHVDATIKAHPRTWFKHLPQQTQVYVQDIDGSRSGLYDGLVNRVTKSPVRRHHGAPTKVIITNNSNSRVTLQTQGAGH